MRETRRIGELLVGEGLISEETVNRALGFQRLSGDHIKLGSILLNWDLLAEDALLATLAKFHRCPAVGWQTLSAADIDAVRLLSPAHAVRFSAIPYALERGALRIAFINPSNLAAIDEVSAIVGKRVAAGVTTEVRLLEAHQKFYGRHIPGPFRTIVAKLYRRRTSQRAVEPVLPDFSTPEEPLDSSGSITSVSVQRPDPGSLSPPDLSAHEPRIFFTNPEIDSVFESLMSSPADQSAQDQSPTHPGTPPKRAVPEEAPLSEEDSLSQWVGEALSSFQNKDQGSGSQPGAVSARAPMIPADPATPVSGQDEVSGMWRPSPNIDSEEVASSMWTSGEEAKARLWEARSREEIGEAVLQNALTHLPRVLLFGAGKGTITGWRGRGFHLSPEEIVSLRISSSEDSVFTAVEMSGIPHFGPVEQAEWPRALAGLLGEKPLECAIFPIRILDGVAAFLYADRLGEAMEYQDFPLIARAAASTANILARFLLRENAETLS